MGLTPPALSLGTHMNYQGNRSYAKLTRDTRESIVDVEVIVELANETGLDNINAQDYCKLQLAKVFPTTILKN